LPTGRSRAPLVLTVDDPTVRLLAREALEEAGFEAVDAQDGESALEVVERTRPDPMLLDVHLPQLDGYAVCALLRKTPEGAHCPILTWPSPAPGRPASS